jgi:hypothetical protein
MSNLSEYKRRRNFRNTAEPAPGKKVVSARKPIFVAAARCVRTARQRCSTMKRARKIRALDVTRPVDGETVWIEYPEGKHFRAEYAARDDQFLPDRLAPIAAKKIANWSRQEHEDVDISDQPTATEKGKLMRS